MGLKKIIVIKIKADGLHLVLLGELRGLTSELKISWGFSQKFDEIKLTDVSAFWVFTCAYQPCCYPREAAWVLSPFASPSFVLP